MAGFYEVSSYLPKKSSINQSPFFPTAKDAMAPQLLVQRPADPAGAVPRAVHLPALQPRGAAAHRLRPTPEEGLEMYETWNCGKQVSFACFEMDMEMR